MTRGVVQAALVAIPIAASVATCGGGGSSSAAPSSPSTAALPATFQFTHSPLDLSEISFIVPLGNLNPPGHTLPTNHIYFWRASSGIPVFAPAGGVVRDLTRTGAGSTLDGSLTVTPAASGTYTLGHVVVDAGIAAGTTLAGGQRVGVTGQSNALDLGQVNSAVSLFFVRPERYIDGTLHADSPLRNYQEPLRSALYSKVRRNGDDKDGKIDFDRPGRLAGNWFLEGLPVSDTENVANGPKHLAFVRDAEDPSLLRISIGGSLSLSGGFYTTDGFVDPADVTPASGVVAYRLYTEPGRFGPGVGLVIVEMLADDRIRIETFAGAATTASFTGAALIYVR